MWKIAGVAALVAAGTSWAVMHLAAEAPAPTDEDTIAALRAQIATLEARLDDAPRAPATLAVPPPAEPVKDDGLAKRVEAVEKQIAAWNELATRKKTGKTKIPMGAVPSKDTLARDLDVLRNLPEKSQPGAYYKAAMRSYKMGWFEHMETLLTELVEKHGDTEMGKEGAYQIGWARRSRQDHAGAREAWLAARDRFDESHYRRHYARFYAASSAAKLGETDTAIRELEDLIRDVTPLDTKAQAQVIQRSERLLGQLRE